MPELDLWLDDRPAATTASKARGSKRTLSYTGALVEQFGAEAPVLSCSLPTPGPTAPAATWAFLEGLLPEGRALEAMAARVRDVRLTAGAEPRPETVTDVVLLLAEYGRECAGAVVVVPAGEPYDPDGGSYRALDDEGLAAAVRDLPDHPLGSDTDREIRMSLAGAQPKFLLARFDDQWFEPVGGAASTHILKPTVRWADSARNEALVMTLARRVGLTPAAGWVETMGDSEVFVAERYDRVVTGPRTVVRRHQEDMCQAVGLRPSQKYDIGRPSGRMARLLRQQATRPAEELRRLLLQVAFRALVGDEDGHGKNYSVLLDGGRVTLAPLYDCLCTVVYPDLSGRMGAPIGRQPNLAGVDRAALVEEAVAMGIAEHEARAHLDELVTSVGNELATLPTSVTAGWDSGAVLDVVAARVERFRAGKRLGPGRSTSPRPATLDALTRRTAGPVRRP